MSETIVQWYERISRDDSFNDVASLMQKRGQLAASTVELAKRIKERGIMLRQLKFTTDLAMKRRFIELTQTTDPATGKTHTGAKADTMAWEQMADSHDKIETAEGEQEGDKIVLRQLNQVLEAMKQDIAELRNVRDNG